MPNDQQIVEDIFEIENTNEFIQQPAMPESVNSDECESVDGFPPMKQLPSTIDTICSQ